MQIEFKKKELFELFKAWLAISLAFGILLTPTLTNDFGSVNGFLIAFSISMITVGLGFVVHELAHKLTAQRFYCSAEFKANDIMLLLAVIMSFAGFVLAAPGAVWIKGGVNKKQNGIISFAGPFSNFVLALLFLPGLFLASGLLFIFFFQGFLINSWLGLFNMIPLAPFDGLKIYKWNKIIYVTLALLLLVMVAFGINIF